ncbi:hypothetical protein FFT88_23840 [Escherichia sp. E4930]|uniref:hypothetical protein n=1 Tax=Escherichia sp. E4930 TaxID=2044468 RepID=UPI00107F440B|nr:hypothetical protein [Escherichia sp. E4930]TGB71782.1 hypothetical protein CRG96_02275 [Escherichia sp. E4930]TLU76978.1 hypothetical protein FFT88_23840 [Escherichia sp. E4930]
MEWVVGGFIVFVILGAMLTPVSCDICGTSFKKKYYTWVIEGKKQRLCPDRNNKMSRRGSNQRFTERFGQ